MLDLIFGNAAEIAALVAGLLAAFFGWTAAQRRVGRRQAEADANAEREKAYRETRERMDEVDDLLPAAAREFLRARGQSKRDL